VRGSGGVVGDTLERRTVLEIYSIRRCKVIMPKGDGLLQTGAAMQERIVSKRVGDGGADFLDPTYIEK
jgi:hypothetical protein